MINCGEIEIENAGSGNPFIFQVLCMHHEELSTIYGKKQKTIFPSKGNLVIALVGKYKDMLDIDKVCTYAMNWLPFQINEIIPDPWDCGKSEMWIILQDNAERDAQSKNSNAQRLVELGFCYLQGKNGYPEDDKKAFQLFKAAAGQNDPWDFAWSVKCTNTATEYNAIMTPPPCGIEKVPNSILDAQNLDSVGFMQTLM